MITHHMTAAQQADLQRQLWTMFEVFRTKQQLSSGALFEFMVAFAWGYARREGESTEAIINQMRARCEACELAYQRALTSQASLPGMGPRS